MKRKRKTLKHMLSLLLAVAMVFGLMPVMPSYVVQASDTSTTSTESTEQTRLDISKGNITIGDGSVSGYDESGNEVTTVDADGYVITGTTTEFAVTVSGGTHNITLESANIDVSSTGALQEYSGSIGSKGSAAFSVQSTANVTITLVGESTLKGGVGCAGLAVVEGATLTINGSGSLSTTGNAGGAGIGADYNTASGAITIDSGYIEANGAKIDDNGSNDYIVQAAAGIGGSSSNTTGTITINGGTIIANGVSNNYCYTADIGSGAYYVSIYDEYTSLDTYKSADATVIINGGNIKAGRIGTGKSGETLTATVTNGSNENVSKMTGKLLGVADGTAIASVAGLPDYFGLASVATFNNEFYFYLPENTELTSVTIGATTYTNSGSNVFINESDFVSNPELNISDGSIVLSVEGGVNYYTVNAGDKIYYAGNVTIKGDKTTATTNTITVNGSTHNITLDGVNIDVSSTGADNGYGSISYGNAAFSIEGTANVTIIFVGENTLKSGVGCAGLVVAQGSTLTINGSGSLTATGNTGGAGIGANYDKACGTIVIENGYITANGSVYSYIEECCEYYMAAGIGGTSTASVGTITINGGTVIANGGSVYNIYAADIGSGTHYVSNYNYKTYTSANATVIINGGNIMADSVGTGMSDEELTATVENSKGEKLVICQGRLLNGVDGITIDNVDSLPDYYNLENAYAVGNAFCFYVPENTEIASITIEGILYTNNGSNIFINELAIIHNPEVSIADGSIAFYVEDGVKYYTVAGGTKNYYTGYVTINGDGTATTNTIVVADGVHDITLDGVNIDVSNTGSANSYDGIGTFGSRALSVDGASKANITLVNDNILKSGVGCAGLNVSLEAEVTIDGEGSLTATGNSGGAGIGASEWSVSGKINIIGGFITANGSAYTTTTAYSGSVRTSAGIGGNRTSVVGKITISGGTVIANGGKHDKTYAADIGSGSYYISEYEYGTTYDSAVATVIIDGGNIKADIIGTGYNDDNLTATVTNTANENVSKVAITLQEVTGYVDVNEVQGIGTYGLNDVQTLDGALYLYLPECANPTLVSSSNGYYVGVVTDGTGTFTKHDCTFDPDKVTYTADEATNTISAVCDTCGTNMGYIALYPPMYGGATVEPIVYNGSEKEATWAYTMGDYTGNNLVNEYVPAIMYFMNGTELDAAPVNVGTYIASLTIDEQKVEVEFTIAQGTPYIGTVTAGVLNNTLDVEDVQLSRTDKTIEGELVLTDTELQYGTHTYNWQFTPSDKNYAVITGTVDITVNDTINPTVTYRIGSEDYKEFANDEAITFETFYDTYKTIEIVYSDGNNGSGLAKKQYYIASEEITDTSSIEWVDYTDVISLDATGKYIIYVRVVDNAGNEVIANSEGIVIYNDSVIGDDTIEGTYKNNGVGYVNMTLNGNTIEKILDNDGNVLNTDAYTVNVDDDTAVITVSSDYLDSLKAGNYTYTVYFNPQGVQADTVGISCEFTINIDRIEIEVVGVAATDRVYDGSQLVDITDIIFQNLRSEDDVKVDFSNLKGTLESADEGTYRLVTLPTLTLIGEDVDNYILIQPTEPVDTNVNVAKKDITNAVVVLDDTALTYNGAEQTKKVTSVKVDGMDVTYVVSGNTATDAGNYQLTITGTGNFKGSVMLDWSIGQKVLTVSGATATDREYNNSTVVDITEISLEGVVDTDEVYVSLEGITGTLSSTNTGTYTSVLLPTLTVAGADAGNYTFVQPTEVVTTSVTVTKKDIANAVVVLDDTALTYNGTEQTKKVTSVNVDGMDVTYVVSGNTATVAGNYQLIITGTGNFKGSVTLDWSIAEPPYVPEGLCKAEDGKWYYYVNGIVDTSYTGLAKNKYGWWYVTSGELDRSYTGMAENKYGIWYVLNGKLDFTYTGMYKYNGTWLYVNNGKHDISYTGLVEYKDTFVYVKEGVLDTTFTSMYKHDGTWVYVYKGKLNTTYTGMVQYNEKLVYVSEGKLDIEFVGMVKYNKTWIYVKAGKHHTSYTGMADNAYGTWYMKEGVLDLTYTGMAKYNDTWVYVTEGKLDLTYTGMAKNKYGWWYMTDGKLDLTYTGMARNQYGWWYMTKGELDLSYTGMARNQYGWWYMTNGELDLSYTGMARNQYGWWHMTNGALDLTYTGISTNEYGWWYMKDGRLDLTYTGQCAYNGQTYDVENGKVIK